MKTRNTAADLEAFGAAYLRLRQLLSEAGEAQWEAGHTPTPREDTTERSKGMTSDPTPNIVADTRRLALRAAVIDVEESLASAYMTLDKSAHQLARALEKWQGA